MKNFWTEDNLKKLQFALESKYKNEFLVISLAETLNENSTSLERTKECAEEHAKKLWALYKEKHNIKASNPRVRIDPIYYRWSTSVTADEYRYVSEGYYNEEKNTVVVESCVCKEEKFIEIPEKLARQILMLHSFKN